MGNDDSDDPFAPRDATVFRPRPGAGKRGAGAPEPRISPLLQPVARGILPGALRDFSAAGLNPLVQAASPLLIVMGQLRTALSYPDTAGLRRQTLEQIREFEDRARAAGVSHETTVAARYVLCAGLDEAVFSTPWGSQSEWGEQSLLVTLHNDARGGERFFEMLEGICAEPGRHIDLMELQYVCLALGFCGRWGVVDRGYQRLAEIQADLYRRIRSARGAPPAELSLQWRGMQDTRNPVIRYVPWWVVGALSLTVLLGAFIYFHTQLAALSAPISNRLAHVSLPVSTAIAAGAAEPPAAPRLKQLLHDDEAAGALTVQERNDQSVVTLTAADLFGSGSAKVNPAYEVTLAHVARALNQVPGRVFVVGHTDDVPLRSLKYRDNYDLSRARAAEVIKLLSLAIDNAGRLEGSGVGDSEPLYTPAALPANRARNRRVEIRHVADR